MSTFLTGLFWDQRCRAQAMLDHLDRGEYSVALPIAFLTETRSSLLAIQKEAEKVINSGTLAFADFDAVNTGRYSRGSELLKDAESRYVVLCRYGKQEVRFSRLLAQIYQEIGLTQALPVVSFISTARDYYWAHCSLGIIGAPLEEERHLLNWPDLYHEIGHFVFQQHSKFLLGQGQINHLVNHHFEPFICSANTQKPRRSAKIWRDKRDQWLNHWLMEFTCDLIATYLTGPAYAWSNFRISSIIDSEQNIYTSHDSHPPHETRMRAIFFMLTRCGWKHKQLKPLKSAWRSHTKLGLNECPKKYRQNTPDHLLKALVECVFEECRQIGLIPYHDQVKSGLSPIACLLNRAWDKMLKDPQNYAEWEATQLRELRGD